MGGRPPGRREPETPIREPDLSSRVDLETELGHTRGDVEALTTQVQTYQAQLAELGAPRKYGGERAVDADEWERARHDLSFNSGPAERESPRGGMPNSSTTELSKPSETGVKPENYATWNSWSGS